MMRLPLRVRVTLAAAVSIAMILAALSFFVYARLQAELVRSADAGLRTRADAIASSMGRAEAGGFDTPDIGASSFAQILTPAGRLEMSRGFRGPALSAAGLRARWIGMLLQSGNLVDHLSVAQNIQAARALVPRALRRGRRDGPPGPDRAGLASAERLLDSVGLAGRASARPSTLSGGEAARAALAVAMANDPPVLFADEPTGEVDRQAEIRVLDLLRRRADRGQAVLVVTHSENVAAAADRVVHMIDGRVTHD